MSRGTLCFMVFGVVIPFWMTHLRVGINWIPRYMYGLFIKRVAIC